MSLRSAILILSIASLFTTACFDAEEVTGDDPELVAPADEGPGDIATEANLGPSILLTVGQTKTFSSAPFALTKLEVENLQSGQARVLIQAGITPAELITVNPPQTVRMVQRWFGGP